MRSALDQLRELRALLEDGLLSREEFDARQHAILDGPITPATPPASAAPAAGTETGLMAGQEVGPFGRRYRLVRPLAQGAMGQVWQATDLATEAELGHSAQLALKILPPRPTRHQAGARLLIEEAARARQLAHPAIVRVYDWAFDPATESHFLIMECLDGEDFEALLKREGTLALARALDLLRPVAAALDHAWECHRLVHRDLKPANLFLTRAGEVKLLDFGIAACAAAWDAQGPGWMAGAGSAGYRAPEAGVGVQAPTPALDVYAVAVMLYRMLSGRLPFDGERAGAVPAPRPDGLGDGPWAVLQAGFAFSAAERPGSVRALLGLLQCEAQADAVATEAAARARIQAEAEAAALAAAQQQRRQTLQQERLARLAAEEARRQRRQVLLGQLAQRRAAELERVRVAAAMARRTAGKAGEPGEPGGPGDSGEAGVARASAAGASPAAAPPAELAELEGVLRDRFLNGSGKGPALVLLPSGRFRMGSSDDERQRALAAGTRQAWLARELPRHWVGLAKPFAMGRHPVTVGEWRGFVRATGWRRSGAIDWEAPGFPQGDSHPVVGVSWHDAQLYLRWLSAATGRRYRLPSEAEWEYACRAGSGTAFWFGESISPEQANYDGNFPWDGGACGASRRGTTPAGMFPANPWGLFDMHGNVWEWVQDVVHDSYDGAPVDGSAWEEGGDPARRILRGGAWPCNPRDLRAALRNGYAGGMSNDIVGFRVVRELP